MKRDTNGLMLAQRKHNARLLVDTESGTIMGYADISGKIPEIRPAVYECIARKGLVILTVGEYIRMTRTEENDQRKVRPEPITAGEWLRKVDEDGTLDNMLKQPEKYIKHFN